MCLIACLYQINCVTLGKVHFRPEIFSYYGKRNTKIEHIISHQNPFAYVT
jgi:hypothetical protein